MKKHLEKLSISVFNEDFKNFIVQEWFPLYQKYANDSTKDHTSKILVSVQELDKIEGALYQCKLLDEYNKIKKEYDCFGVFVHDLEPIQLDAYNKAEKSIKIIMFRFK